MNSPAICLATIPALLALHLPTPVQVILFCSLFVLIIIDFITGCCRSYKTGQAITSHKMGCTVNKMIAYFGLTLISLVVAFVAKEVLAMGLIADSLVAMILGFCNIRESYSILENIQKLGIRLPKFLKKLMKTVEDTMDDTKEE